MKRRRVHEGCSVAIPTRAIYYHWESFLYRKNIVRTYEYTQEFGCIVQNRDTQGKASTVRLRIYVNDNSRTLYLIGPFNEWGKQNRESFRFSPVEETGFQELTTNALTHKDPYLILIVHNGSEYILRDPATIYFDDKGNSVFWDFGDPGTYQKKYAQPDTLHRATKILQTDPVGLVAKWYEYDTTATTLADSKQDLFTFIATCGVLDKVHELGFNTIQLLPTAQSIDGDNWKYRYLVAYPFAVHKNFGTPDSFKHLVDECHKRGIALITDLIISHCPYKDYQLCGLRGEDVGLHRWGSKYNEETYLQEFTPWGSMRFRYGDEHVRRYLVESALHTIKEYGVDGFRIDNIDGILRYGDAGQGEDRPYGRQFVRELIAAIYDINPVALIHLESHYFYGDNAKMLVAPQSLSDRAIGATAYNSSRLTYYFHKEFMPKAIQEVPIWKFEQIREEKEWGRSNSTIADFHNHDAAAGLMHGRATGSYAYDALILKNPELHFHAVGKIKVMEAIIAFGTEGRILDLAQTFLLQEGTFEHDSSIHWNLLNTNSESKKVMNYKQRVNEILEAPAFWAENTLYRQYINVDEHNKILVIKREDKTQGTNELYIIIINLSTQTIYNYSVGLHDGEQYEVVFNSDEEQYAGTKTSLPTTKKVHHTDQFAVFTKAITFESIAPYQVLVMKRV